MADVKLLFGDIVAMENENGKLVIRKGEQQVSPFEYVVVRKLTPKCYALFRMDVKKYDLIFPSGTMVFGCHFAYNIENMFGSGQKNLIAAGILHGTHVIDDSGNYFAFIPRQYHLALAEDRFLLAIILKSPEPYARVYDIFGRFLAEGFLSKALDEARHKVKHSSKLAC